MEAGSSSRPERAQDPTETTALLGSPALSLHGSATSHERTALEGTDVGQPNASDDGEPASGSAVAMLQRNMKGFVWISLILASFLIALAIAICALLERRPDSFRSRYRFQEALSVVSSYAVVLLGFNIWSLRRRTYNSFEPWAVLIALVIDALAAAYTFNTAGEVASWIPDLSSCGTWDKHGHRDTGCHPFVEVFDGVTSTWAVIGVFFALTHLILFLLRVNYLVRTFHTTRYISYDGTVASETLTSFNLTLGPFAFDFRFSVRHPPRDLPAGAVREGVVRMTEQA